MRAFIPWLAALSLGLLLTHTPTAPAGQPSKRPSDMDRGQQLWERHCWQCHGATNQGDGPAAAALVHTVPNLIDQIVVTDELARLVLKGKGAMPGYEQSFDFHDARRVLKYQVSLGKEPEVEEPAEPEPVEGD